MKVLRKLLLTLFKEREWKFQPVSCALGVPERYAIWVIRNRVRCYVGDVILDGDKVVLFGYDRGVNDPWAVFPLSDPGCLGKVRKAILDLEND